MTDALEPLPPAPSRPVRLAAIGLGHIWETAHLPALRSLRAAGWRIELAGACDRDPARVAAALAACPGARAAGDVDALLAMKPDALLVALPSGVTADVVRAACGRVGAILAEKPVADAVAPIEDSAAAAERAGCRVQVAFNRTHLACAPRFLALARASGARHLAVRFWRVKRGEAGFYDDVLGHPLSFASLFGSLAIEHVRVDRRGPGELPAGALVLARCGDLSLAIDCRPATGRMLEEYVAIGERASTRLVFQFGHVAADPQGLWRIEGGAVEPLHVAGADADHVALAGFTHQLAAFARLAAGDLARPACGLREAAAIQGAIRRAMATIVDERAARG